MPRILSVSFLLCWLTVLPALARPQIPEGPTGVAVCSDQTDNDLDETVDAIDPSCTTAQGFSAASGGFAAQAESFTRSGAWEVVADTTANGGSYARVPLGGDPFAGEIATGGVTTPGTYYVWALVNIPSSTSAALWIQAGLTPFQGPPDNSDAAALNNDQPTSGWTWLQLGRLDRRENWQKVPKLQDTPQRTLIIASGDLIHIMALPGLGIDCLYLHTSPTVPPQCPLGGAGVTEDYVVKEVGAFTPTINGLEDSAWPSANVLTLQGSTSPTPPVGTWTTRLVWSDPLNRLYFLLKTSAVANLTATTNTGHDGTLTQNRLELLLRFADLNKVLDASTYKVACDNGSFIWDANYPSGASDKTYDFTAACTATYTANVLIIEGYIQPTETLTADSFFLVNGLIQELVTGSAGAYQYVRGTSNSIGNALVAKLSATTITGSADTTAPTMGTVSFTNVTSTSFSASSVCTETGSAPCTCQLGYGTGTVASGFVCGVSGVTCPASSIAVGGTCSTSVTGLSASTAYNVRMRGTDQTGNSGVSASAAQTTSSAGTTRWIRPDGVDTGSCTNSASPCKRFDFAAKLLQPGETLMLRNGTYTDGTTGLPNIDCAAGYRDGTTAQPITMRAENERQARVNDTVVGKNVLRVWNCSNWKVEGIVWTSQAHSNDPTPLGAAMDIKFSPNFTFKRNILVTLPGTNNCLFNAFEIRDDSDNAVIEENEFYGSLRDSPMAKYNGGGVFRRNYVHDRSAIGDVQQCSSGSGHTQIQLYPGWDWIMENNISDHTWPNPTNANAFGCGGYSRSSGKACRNLRYLGNIAYNSTLGFNVHPAAPTNTDDPDSRPLDITVEHMLVVGLPSTPGGAAGLQFESCENAVIRRSTVMGMGSTKVGIYTKKPSAMPDSAFFSFSGQDLLAVNNGGTAFLIDSSVDSWDVDGLHVFNNGTNYSAKGSGNCTNCTGIVTTNPNIGTKTVWTGLSTGAEILYKYQNGTLTTNKLWTQTPPSGCPTVASGWYPAGAGPCVAGVNNSYADSYYSFADRLGITSANLPPGY